MQIRVEEGGNVGPQVYIPAFSHSHIRCSLLFAFALLISFDIIINIIIPSTLVYIEIIFIARNRNIYTLDFVYIYSR